MSEISNETVVRTKGLSKSFKEVDALIGLDLDVSEHSIFGFLGPNGAGKTTTIKLLLGLSRPTAGNAKVFGLDAVDDSLEIRRRIGYLALGKLFASGRGSTILARLKRWKLGSVRYLN